jgi:hypothetical protein
MKVNTRASGLYFSVMPAKAGIQSLGTLDSRLRGSDVKSKIKAQAALSNLTNMQ